MSKPIEQPDLIDAVVWIPGDFDTNGKKFEHGDRIVIPRHLFNRSGWTYSAMSEKLGFPVKFRRVRAHDYDVPGPIPLRRNNSLACFLDLCVDLWDFKHIGLRLSEDQLLDEMIFARQDGGPLQVQHITALWAFATLHADKVVHFPRGMYQNLPLALHEAGRLAALLSPQSFARLFEDLCAGVVWQDKTFESTPVPKWFEGIENPVLQVCAACSNDKMADGGGLQICSKCRRRQYCSKECQEADHLRHKRYCCKS